MHAAEHRSKQYLHKPIQHYESHNIDTKFRTNILKETEEERQAREEAEQKAREEQEAGTHTQSSLSIKYD